MVPELPFCVYQSITKSPFFTDQAVMDCIVYSCISIIDNYRSDVKREHKFQKNRTDRSISERCIPRGDCKINGYVI